MERQKSELTKSPCISNRGSKSEFRGDIIRRKQRNGAAMTNQRYPPSDMGLNALGNYLRVPFTFVCNEREVVDDWPGIDGQFCQTSRVIPTKTVKVDMVKMLWLRRGVKVGRG